jgi:hypothetical protein
MLVSLALLAIFVAAIGLTPTARAAARPCVPSCGISILSPGKGLNTNANVGPSFIVSFKVENFTLAQPGTVRDNVNTTTGTGANDVPNRGHIHVFVDNVYSTLWAGPEGIPLTLSAGSHTIKLELVNDYHQSFNSTISDSTTVNVTDPLRSLQSSADTSGTFSIVALAVSVITLALVAYVAVARTRKPKA